MYKIILISKYIQNIQLKLYLFKYPANNMSKLPDKFQSFIDKKKYLK